MDEERPKSVRPAAAEGSVSCRLRSKNNIHGRYGPRPINFRVAGALPSWHLTNVGALVSI